MTAAWGEDAHTPREGVPVTPWTFRARLVYWSLAGLVTNNSHLTCLLKRCSVALLAWCLWFLRNCVHSSLSLGWTPERACNCLPAGPCGPAARLRDTGSSSRSPWPCSARLRDTGGSSRVPVAPLCQAPGHGELPCDQGGGDSAGNEDSEGFLFPLNFLEQLELELEFTYITFECLSNSSEKGILGR